MLTREAPGLLSSSLWAEVTVAESWRLQDLQCRASRNSPEHISKTKCWWCGELLWKRAAKGTSIYFAQEILGMNLIGWEKPALKSQSAELCVVLRFIKIAFTTAGLSGGLPHFCLKSISRYCVKFPKKRTGWLKVFEKQTWLDCVCGMEFSL